MFLNRTGMSEVTKVHCLVCRNYLCEVVNSSVSHVSDVVTFENTENIGVGIRCSGTVSPGVKCHRYYYLMVGATA